MKFTAFRSKFSLFPLLVFLLMGFALPAQAIKIEEAMRVLQERHYLVRGEYLVWPARHADFQVPPSFPPDGFYVSDLGDAQRAAFLVRELRAALNMSPALGFFFANENALEGSEESLSVGLENLPPASSVTNAENYREHFDLIAKKLCDLRFLLRYADPVITSRKGMDFSQDGYSWESILACFQSKWKITPSAHHFRNCEFSHVEGFTTTEQGLRIGSIVGGSPSGLLADTIHGSIMVRMPSTAVSKVVVFAKFNHTLPGGTYPYFPPSRYGSPEPNKFRKIGVGARVEMTANDDIERQASVLPVAQSWEVSGWLLFDAKALVEPTFEHYITNCAGDANDCAPCSAGSCNVGSGSPEAKATDGLGSLKFDLGRDISGERGVSLGLTLFGPSADNYSPAALTAKTGEGTALIRDANQAVRQLKAPEATADVVTVSANKYQIKFYKPSQVSANPNSSGFHTFSGSPFRTWTIENPNTATTDNVKLTETSGSQNIAHQYTWVIGADGSKETILSNGNGLRKESSKTSKNASGDRVQTFTVMNADNTVVYKEENTFHVFPWGEEKIKRVVDPAGAKLTTTWSYYDDSSDASNYKNLKQVVQPSGYWEKHTYDTYGRVIKTVSQFKNNSTTSADASNRVVTTIYADGDPAITVIEKLQDKEISRRYTVYRPGETQEIQAHAPGAAWNDSKNLVTITKTLLGTEFQGEISSIRHPDGTLTTYQYSKSGNQKTVTTQTGAASGGSVVDGNRRVTVSRLDGTRLSEHQYDISTGILLSSEIVTQQDDFGRPTTIQFLDGTTATKVYGCCGLESETDREGITTTYIYDDLKRVKSSTRAGITTLYSYDANGNVLTATRKGSDNSSIAVSTRTYDQVGRLKSDKNALNNTTTFAESKDSSGQTLRTTTDPLGNKVTDTFFKDGSLRYRKGTATHPIQMDYGATTSNETFEKQIFLGPSGETTEWATSYRDFLGRISRAVRPGSATERSYFNNQGQLIKQTDADGVTTLFQYNARGELEYTALDMNKNGVIDFSGTDRITQITRTVLPGSASGRGTTVYRTTQKVYTQNGATSTRDITVVDESVDGLQTWSTMAGLTTHTRTFFDSPGVHRVVTTQPDGTVSTQTFTHGRLSTAVTQNPATGVLSSFSYAYDAHGRQKSITDVRTGTTTLTYDSGDRLKTVKTPVPATGQSAQTTTFYYDKANRRIRTLLPDGKNVYTEYHPTGEIKRQYGARVYDTSYTIDFQGRMKTLVAGGQTTTWHYTADRGFLASKIYPDGKGPAYTYFASGRLKTRTWARGITTSYNYNNAGDLQKVDYSDSTPDVTYTFDRLGQMSKADLSRTGATESTNYTRDNAGQLIKEVYSGGILNGMMVSNRYDSLYRRTKLWVSKGSTVFNSKTYTFDGASRHKTATDGTRTATYTYLSNSSLVQSVAFQSSGTTHLTTTRTYDNINRLTSVNNVIPGEANNLNFIYDHNSANQRTKVTLADGSYWIYQYDDLGQVVSGRKYFADGTAVEGQQFEYGFDSIGNRTSASKPKVDGTNPRVSTYTPNNLNQYAQRTVPGSIDVMGTAKADSKVTVNLQQSERKGEYFYKELPVGNASAPVHQNVEVIGVKTGVGAGGEDAINIESGNVFVPKTPELFSYDLDGNLLSDGRNIYTWDGENRLVSVERLAPSSHKLKLEFAYDHQGRRIQKKVFNWSGSAWVLSSTTKCIYDQWMKVVELNGSDAAIKNYMWGLDLSGSFQGAGGVGGLLLMRDYASSSYHFYSYDGNGNVAGLVNAATGKLSAVYEYGPFGEPIRSSGSMAKSNSFRFSTKYQDDESGLLYYGYRFYNPSTGRWLSREPLGEMASKNLYGFVSNKPVQSIDVLGMYEEDGHFYTSFILATIAGYSHDDAFALAFYTQLPDELDRLSALGSLDSNIRKELSSGRKHLHRLQNYLHSLHGDDVESRRECLKRLLQDPELSLMERGLLLHAFGDSYSHAYAVSMIGEPRFEDYDPIDYKGYENAFSTGNAFFPGLGHGFRSITSQDPDMISRRPTLYGRFVEEAFSALNRSGEMTYAQLNQIASLQIKAERLGEINASYGVSINEFYKLARDSFGYRSLYRPEFYSPGKMARLMRNFAPEKAKLPMPTETEVNDFLKKVENACCPK
jgi:RHS repeat-associated protein